MSLVYLRYRIEVMGPGEGNRWTAYLPILRPVKEGCPLGRPAGQSQLLVFIAFRSVKAIHEYMCVGMPRPSVVFRNLVCIGTL